MKALSKIVTAGVGVAALVGSAAPAAAQYGYGGGGDVLGAIINTVLGQSRYGGQGYGGYGYDPQRERYLVEQCARATETRIQRNYGAAGYSQYGYGNGYSQYGYGNQGYNGYSQARIVNLTRVERRSNGGMKVYGIATSGRGYSNNGYGGYGGQYGGQYGGGYGYNANAGADLTFDCTIAYNGRILDIDVNRASNNYGYRGY